MEIVIASENKGKIKEFKELFRDTKYKIVSKSEKCISIDPDETGNTLRENAEIKVREIYKITGGYVLADDSGIFVRALDWKPGVHSSRFSGENATDEKNNELLIKLLKDKEDKYAEYRAVIALMEPSGDIHFFEGICKGRITENPKGIHGFGYDPYFIPENYDKTFGELFDEVKNKISHRAMAIEKMMKYFNENM